MLKGCGGNWSFFFLFKTNKMNFCIVTITCNSCQRTLESEKRLQKGKEKKEKNELCVSLWHPVVERDVWMLGSHAFSSLAKECKPICHRQMSLSTARLGCLVTPVRPYLATLLLHNLKATQIVSLKPIRRENQWRFKKTLKFKSFAFLVL